MRKQSARVQSGQVICVALGIISFLGPLTAADTQTPETQPPSVRAAARTEARAIYLRAKTAQKEGHDAAAAQAYKDAIAIAPDMVSALNDLAYLQATSFDPSVRNPKEATNNGMLAQAGLTRLLHQKVAGEFSPSGERDTRSYFLGMKACIFNTIAAARAADNDYTRAYVYLGQSIRAAEALAASQPTAESAALLQAVRSNEASIKYKQSLQGVRAMDCKLDN